MAFFDRVSKRQVVMLADEREDHCGHVRFEREPRDQPLVKRGVFGEEYVERDLDPGRL